MNDKLMVTVTVDQVHFILINVGRVEKTPKRMYFALLSKITSLTVLETDKIMQFKRNVAYTRVTNAHCVMSLTCART